MQSVELVQLSVLAVVGVINQINTNNYLINLILFEDCIGEPKLMMILASVVSAVQ